ncbi:MAG: AAA family ATPase [Aestuariivita sp.]|nr:AAA family ATPase [Aestuariivita sp.]MCY4202948.1 AAA family ATPase [Aestuariivita sp.]
MIRQHLPIGVQNFKRLRETDSYYVDKTASIHDLVERGDHYFLSRPRRFGKSLLLDTIGALFAGQETLFRGLDIHDDWDWSVSHPVVRLSFDGSYNGPEDIERSILARLTVIERRAELTASIWPTAPEYLFDVLERLHHKTGQRVVVLVDEYDKPILDALHDLELAAANRDYLHGFYGMIKGSAEHIRFVFVTGVSMFSKVSLFSGLNNLKDISLDPRYATICGYTDADIDTVFAPELEDLDREMIRTWYNGYSWRGTERVYNPFDVLLLFDTREFRPHWFETGSPTFLFQTLKANAVSPKELENQIADMASVSKFDINDIDFRALLLQAGYLTIVAERHDGFGTLFQLDYPNHEVRISLNRGLLEYLGKTVPQAINQGHDLCALLAANDFEGFAATLKAYFASIPYQWHTTGDLARYEAWYEGLLHMCFRALGVDIRSEEVASRGRADMVVLTGGQVFIFEFKMVETAQETAAALSAGLAQMRQRGYAEKYRGQKDPVHLIAVVCGRDARTLLDLSVAPL